MGSIRPLMRGLALIALVSTAVVVASCGGSSTPANPSSAATPAAAAITAATAPASSTPSLVATATAPATPTKLGTYTDATTKIIDPSFQALPGATATFGALGKAPYQIEKPDNWNHELVLFVHGWVGLGPELQVQQPPQGLRQVLISEGFAWAASAFSENGHTPGIGADDTLALKRFFESTNGKPNRTYLIGESMGGNAVAVSLEHFAGEYDGAVAACGALTGEGEIDYLISYGMVAQYISGVTFPIGQGFEKMGAALAQLPAIFGTPDAPTLKGKQFADAIRNLTGGPRPFFIEGFADHEIANLGLLALDPNRQLLVARAATNVDTKYHVDGSLGLSDDVLNAGVQRLIADPTARDAAAHPDAVPTTGVITKPLLTIHGTGDLFVPISNEIIYRARVVAAGKGDLLVQRAIRSHGHCKFSPAEYRAAFDDLVAWVEQGKKPAGDDLTGDLSNIGMTFTNPLRDGDPGRK
jgi:pimeloyl-ACP methyl ester carboxylesterase